MTQKARALFEGLLDAPADAAQPVALSTYSPGIMHHRAVAGETATLQTGRAVLQ
jgi:hypothetical protein